MRTRFLRYLTFVGAAVLLCVAPAFAQTTLNSTTLSAAMTAGSAGALTIPSLTSTSTIAVGDYLVIDGEFMRVLSLSPTRVRRGVFGVAFPHANGSVVWTGVRSRFYDNEPVGSCTATAELYLPHISFPSANVYDCIGSEWTLLKQGGLRRAAGLIDTTSTASGTVQSTEYTLNSVTIPATEWVGARGVRCVAWGTTTANANAKNIKFYFGATAVSTLTGTTDSAKDYLGEIVVLRTGASTQAGYGAITSDIGAPDAFAVTTSLAETETSSIVIALKTANTAAAAGSATGKGMHCSWLP
jgi:hypothetical protein